MRWWLATVVLCGLAGADEVALAQAAERHSASIPLSTDRRGAPATASTAIDWFDAANPDGKPHSTQRLVIRFPAGTVIDTAAAPRCSASDEELMAQGASACPAASRISAGTLTTDTGSPFGFPRFVVNDLIQFNTADGLVGLAESRGEPQVRVVSRSRIEGATITSDIPPTPGSPPPDPFTAFKQMRLQPVAAARLYRGRAYLRTPRACPRSGAWTTAVTVTYADGVTQTAGSTSPCRGH